MSDTKTIRTTRTNLVTAIKGLGFIPSTPEEDFINADHIKEYKTKDRPSLSLTHPQSKLTIIIRIKHRAFIHDEFEIAMYKDDGTITKFVNMGCGVETVSEYVKVIHELYKASR